MPKIHIESRLVRGGTSIIAGSGHDHGVYGLADPLDGHLVVVFAIL